MFLILCANMFVPINVILYINKFCNWGKKTQKSLVGSGIICNFYELEYPSAEVPFAYKAATWGWDLLVLLFSGSMLCSPRYLLFLKDQLCNGVVVYFQFPLPPLSLTLFEATSSPGAEFLFTFPNSFSIRSDPVLWSFSSNWSNLDPSKVSSESPVDSAEPVYLLPDLNSATQLSFFACFQVKSTIHLGFGYGIQVTPVPFT